MNKIILIIILLYLLPTFVQYKYSDENRIIGQYLGLPIIQTGDEPHYYITLYSLVNDKDMFLTNNYNNALYNNGPDLGTKKLSKFDRHIRFYDPITRKILKTPAVLEMPIEIPGHFIGLPIFAFIFLWPFSNTVYLEHLAIYLTLIFSVLGVFAFYRLMNFYHKNKKTSILFTFLFALGTQYWHYSKTFWTEPYLTSFLIISLYFVVLKKNYFTASFLLGIGFTMKPTFILSIIPFYLYLFLTKNRKIRTFVEFSLPLVIIFLISLTFNYYLTGNPLQFNKVTSGVFYPQFINFFHLLFDPMFGLFIFSPVLIYSLFGIKNFWSKDKSQCFCLILIFLINVVFISGIMNTHSPIGEGAGGYASRYLTPIIPILAIFCSFANIDKKYNCKIFYSLLTISFLINLFSAFVYPAFTGYTIWTSFEKILKFIV